MRSTVSCCASSPSALRRRRPLACSRVVRPTDLNARRRCCASTDDVFRATEAGRIDYAVVPVENSTEGAVGRTLDLMLLTPLTVVGEIKLRIQQNLLAKGISIDAVTKVYSHAQSLAQCVRWLAQQLPSAARVAVASNAEAARLAASEPGAAAIAGEAA